MEVSRMTKAERAALVLGGALVVGALAQQVIRTEARILGLSDTQLAVLGLAASYLITH